MESVILRPWVNYFEKMHLYFEKTHLHVSSFFNERWELNSKLTLIDTDLLILNSQEADTQLCQGVSSAAANLGDPWKVFLFELAQSFLLFLLIQGEI